MPDKTVVTNPPVGSGSGENPKGQGDDLAREVENRVRENLRGEYSRKEEALQEKLQATENRIAELEEKNRLSADDRELLDRLRGKSDNLSEELRILETDPKYRAYNEKIKRDTEKSRTAAIAESEFNTSTMMVGILLRQAAKSEGIKVDELKKEINELIGDEGGMKDKLPHERFEIAMDKRESRMMYKKREDELKKKELELNGNLEDGKGVPREQTLAEIKEKGDTIALAKKLGL